MLTALFITWAAVTIFAIIAFGWREELKLYRKIEQSKKAVRGEHR